MGKTERLTTLLTPWRVDGVVKPLFLEFIQQYLNGTRQRHGDTRLATPKDAERYISKRESPSAKTEDKQKLEQLYAEFVQSTARLPTVDKINVPGFDDPRPPESLAAKIGRLATKARLGRHKQSAIAEAERLGIAAEVFAEAERLGIGVVNKLPICPNPEPTVKLQTQSNGLAFETPKST